MNVVPRVISRRLLLQGVLQRTTAVNYLRCLSSESNGDDVSKKKSSISSLLSSLKHTGKKDDLEDVLQRKKAVKEDASVQAQKDRVRNYENTAEKLSKAQDVQAKKPLTSHVAGKSDKDAMADIYSSDPKQPATPEMNDKLKSILSKLKVDTAKSQLSRDIVGAVKSWGRMSPRSRMDIENDFRMQSQPEPVRVSKAISFTSGARLELFDDIFNNDKVSFKETLPGLKLLEGEDMELLEKQKSLDQRNDFLTLIEIADKQWKFPVDNEACKVEEENVGFEEHVFLGYLLDNFPKKGPVRRFMELVVNGLEQNPYMTVEQKKNQVSWFEEYFENVPEEDLSF